MQRIKIDSIIVRQRKRPLRDIEALKQSIKKLGLLNPVTINRNSVLVAGYHRLEACKALGWSEIPAEVVNYDNLQAELAEIDENMIRNKLTALETAEQLKRRKEIYETLYPETKASSIFCKNLIQFSPQWHDATPGKVTTFVKDCASKTGKNPSTIHKYIKIADTLTGDLVKTIKGSAIEDKFTDLLTLCRTEDPDRQLELINKVKSGEAMSIRAAISRETRERNKNKLPDLNKNFVPAKAYKVLLKRFNELELKHYRLEQEYDKLLRTNSQFPYNEPEAG